VVGLPLWSGRLCKEDSLSSARIRGQGGTEAGALVCGGQYVDHGGNLEECVESLRALFDIEAKGYAYGESECSGDAQSLRFARCGGGRGPFVRSAEVAARGCCAAERHSLRSARHGIRPAAR
jgi:hypothetical protein